MSVNDLVKRWRDFAMQDVPKDYSERGLTQKYLRGDNAAGGAWDAADELEDEARTAWHPVSDPPAEGYDTDLVLVWQPGWTECMVDKVGNVRLRALRGDSVMQWAHQRDVVLLPPQSTTGEGE